MKHIAIVLAALVLLGCEATPVQNAGEIRTNTKLNAGIQLPIDVSVAYYVDKSKPDSKINFYGTLEEATDLVTKDIFSTSESLTSTSDFDYLIQLGAVSDWDFMWGGYDSDLKITIKNRQGETLFSRDVVSKASGSGGFYDLNAVYNAFAKSIKENLIEFLNTNGSNLVVPASQHVEAFSIKDFFENVTPEASGTGFYIDNEGTIVTAAHVVAECIFVEVNHKGQTFTADVAKSSNLLDLAVLTTDYSNPESISIDKSVEPSLGKQMFATGFPLSNLLSDYPSMTLGNVTSQGGLKGAKGSFQFSAPIQPGNSGGAVVDFKGHLLGVVSGTLNQSMMLSESGTTSQNVNFAIDTSLLTKFLDNGGFNYSAQDNAPDFEAASKAAVEYTNQVLCYQ